MVRLRRGTGGGWRSWGLLEVSGRGRGWISDVAAKGRDGVLRCLPGKVRSVNGLVQFGSVSVCIYARKARVGSPVVWRQTYMDVSIN